MIAGAGGRDHGSAQMLGELHGKSGDAAGAALDQNGLAGFEMRGVFDGGERGEADEPERRGFGMAQRSRLLGDDRRLDGDLFRVGAFDALVGHAEHGIADFEIGDARAERADRRRRNRGQEYEGICSSL